MPRRGWLGGGVTGGVVMLVMVPDSTVGSRLCHRVTDVVGYRLASAVISTVLDPMPELGEVGLVWVVCDGCSLGDCVRLYGSNPIKMAERSLDDRLLGRPMKSCHVENCCSRRGALSMPMAGVRVMFVGVHSALSLF